MLPYGCRRRARSAPRSAPLPALSSAHRPSSFSPRSLGAEATQTQLLPGALVSFPGDLVGQIRSAEPPRALALHNETQSCATL